MTVALEPGFVVVAEAVRERGSDEEVVALEHGSAEEVVVPEHGFVVTVIAAPEHGSVVGVAAAPEHDSAVEVVAPPEHGLQYSRFPEMPSDLSEEEEPARVALL